MPKSKEAKAVTKENILHAAGRGFRAGGYGGIGVDGISKDAGVTSGAFYAHFGSKANAFEQALVYGMGCVREKIVELQEQYGPDSAKEFIKYYFQDQINSSLSEACALPTLSADVARANKKTHMAYEAELAKIAQTLSTGIQGDDADSKLAKAWAVLSICIGGSSMVRALENEKIKTEITNSCREQALAIVA